VKRIPKIFILTLAVVLALSTPGCELLSTYDDVTVDAPWITFVPGHGIDDIIRNAEDGSVEMPDIPHRDGYEFTGWFYSPDGGKTLGDEFVNVGISGSAAVYANWYKAATGGLAYNIAPGMYDTPQTLVLHNGLGLPIFYTTDGSDPVELAPDGLGGYIEAESTKVYGGSIDIYDRRSERPRLHDRIDTSMIDYENVSLANPPDYNRGTVIKAATLKENNRLSEIWTGTYLVWDEEYYGTAFNLPIMSIAINEELLFGAVGDESNEELGTVDYPYYGGIYRAQWGNNLKEVKHLATFEYFDKDKNPIFFRDGSIKIAGNYTQSMPQKSFNVNLNKGVYNDAVSYPIWGNMKRGDRTPLTSFSRFKLDNHGNSYWCAGWNDDLANRLCDPLDIGSKAGSSVAVYLNGDFWGIYVMQEHYDDRFFADHYNAKDRKNIIQTSFDIDGIPNTRDGDVTFGRESYFEMYNYALQREVFSDEDYREFEERYMDLNHFIDAYLVNIFVNNSDWPSNNNRMWRAEKPEPGNLYMDGRWRPVIHDLDIGFSGADQDILAHLLYQKEFIRDWANLPFGTLFFRRLFTNELFRTRFLERVVFFYNSVFDVQRVQNINNRIYEERASMQPYHGARWYAYHPFAAINIRKSYDEFLVSRREEMLKHFKRHYTNPYITEETQIEVPAHCETLEPVYLEFESSDEQKSDVTKLRWTYCIPSDAQQAPAVFKSGIEEWPNTAAVKQALVFNNMWVQLENDDADFCHYEISTDGGETYQTVVDRSYAFLADSLHPNITVRTVYAPALDG